MGIEGNGETALAYEIEIGDFVEIVTGENVGFIGILDNEFVRNGVVTYN